MAAKTEARVTKSGVARPLIKAGKTNAEVLVALKKAFPKDDWEKHATYPSWYRSDMVQKGEITKDFASKHAGDRPGEAKKAPAKKAAAPKVKKAEAKTAPAATAN